MNDKNVSIPDDEIDFTSLWQKLKSVVFYPFILLFKHRLISLVFIILGISAAWAFKLSVNKTYCSSFIIRPNDRSDKFHVRMLEDVRALIKQKDYNTLTQLLKIDSVDLRSINELEVYTASNKVFRDSVNYTEVVIESTNYRQFIPLQNALLNYLESNPYYHKIKTVEQTRMEIENPMIEKDLQMLDSLKKLQINNYANQKISNQNAMLIGESGDPVAFYHMGIDRMDKKYKLLAAKAFLDNFQLVKSCVEVKKPNWPPRLIILILFAVPASLVVCFFFLVIYHQLKNISR